MYKHWSDTLATAFRLESHHQLKLFSAVRCAKRCLNTNTGGTLAVLPSLSARDISLMKRVAVVPDEVVREKIKNIIST